MSEHEIPENVSGSEEEQVASAQPADPVGRWPKPKHTSAALEKLGAEPAILVKAPDNAWLAEALPLEHIKGMTVGEDPAVYIENPYFKEQTGEDPAVYEGPVPGTSDTEGNQAEPAQPEQDPGETEFTEVLEECRKLLALAARESNTTGKDLIDMMMLHSKIVFDKLNSRPENLLDEVDDEYISHGVIAASGALLNFMEAAARKDSSYLVYRSQVKMVVSSIINAMENKLNKYKLAVGS
ncbi:MAG: hypothetical protein [Caudoviricetes sp.]|nr:MAG: hypothetical protein [Caudoviricetes sp.]